MEPEYFQYLLLMLVAIARGRPYNLCLVSSLVDQQLAREMLSQQHDIGPSYKTKVRPNLPAEGNGCCIAIHVVLESPLVKGHFL